MFQEFLYLLNILPFLAAELQMDGRVFVVCDDAHSGVFGGHGKDTHHGGDKLLMWNQASHLGKIPQ